MEIERARCGRPTPTRCSADDDDFDDADEDDGTDLYAACDADAACVGRCLLGFLVLVHGPDEGDTECRVFHCFCACAKIKRSLRHHDAGAVLFAREGK